MDELSYGYPRGIRFQCLRCTQCCGDTKNHVRRILMLKIEVQRIARLTAKPIGDFAIETGAHDMYEYEMRKTPGRKKCVFLERGSCTIYQNRPMICKFYPFEFRSRDEGEGEFRHTEECPGIGKGMLTLGKAHFEDLHECLTRVAGVVNRRIVP